MSSVDIAQIVKLCIIIFFMAFLFSKKNRHKKAYQHIIIWIVIFVAISFLYSLFYEEKEYVPTYQQSPNDGSGINV